MLSKGITILTAGFFVYLLIYSLVSGLPSDLTLATRLLFGIISFIILLSLKIHFPYTKEFLLAVASTLLMLWVVEFYLDYSTGSGFELRPMIEAAEREGIPFDTRTKKEVIEDLRSVGVGAYSNFVGSELLDERSLYPLNGTSLTPTLTCNELGEWITYPTDEHGFNNPLGLWSEDSIQIVSIGDSFTWGHCVTQDKSIPGLLRTQYPGSLNLGVPGTGSLKQLTIMREYLGELNPARVLWFYWEGNDLRNLSSEIRNSVFRRYLDDADYTQRLYSQQEALDAKVKRLLDQEIVEERKRVKLREVFFLSEIRGIIRSTLRKPIDCDVPDSLMAQFQETISKGKDHVDTWEGELYFVYLPSWTRYGNPEIRTCHGLWNPLYTYPEILSIAEEGGVKIIDLVPIFLAHPDPLSLFTFRLDGHYDEEGYQLVAEAVLEALGD